MGVVVVVFGVVVGASALLLWPPGKQCIAIPRPCAVPSLQGEYHSSPTGNRGYQCAEAFKVVGGDMYDLKLVIIVGQDRQECFTRRPES